MPKLTLKTIPLLLIVALIISGCSQIYRVRIKDAIRLEIIEDEASYKLGQDHPVILNLRMTNTSDESVPITLLAGSFLLKTIANEVWCIEDDRFMSLDDPGCPEYCFFRLRPGESEIIPVEFVSVPGSRWPLVTVYVELFAVYQVSARHGDVEREYSARSRDALLMEVKRKRPWTPIRAPVE